LRREHEEVKPKNRFLRTNRLAGRRAQDPRTQGVLYDPGGVRAPNWRYPGIHFTTREGRYRGRSCRAARGQPSVRQVCRLASDGRRKEVMFQAQVGSSPEIALGVKSPAKRYHPCYRKTVVQPDCTTAINSSLSNDRPPATRSASSILGERFWPTGVLPGLGHLGGHCSQFKSRNGTLQNCIGFDTQQIREPYHYGVAFFWHCPPRRENGRYKSSRNSKNSQMGTAASGQIAFGGTTAATSNLREAVTKVSDRRFLSTTSVYR
jgi:hypothetical protein